jgi:hypothetical protein
MEDPPSNFLIEFERQRSRENLKPDALRRALQSCIEDHGSHCDRLRHVLLAGDSTNESIYQQPLNLRVLDVNTLRVQLAPASCQYIALSYVWSHSRRHLPSFFENQFSVAAKTRDAKASSTELPQTVVDAIAVCRAIGINFLWVDSMCIDQNDQRDVQHQVARMDRIYSFAIATIIVAGNTKGNGNFDCVRQPDPGHYLQMSALEDILEGTEWSTRGWTYQEFLLSRRLIIFTSRGVYYHCVKGGGSLSGWSLPSIEEASCWNVYNKILTSYTRRRISRKSDTLNAITGMLRVLARYSNDAYIAGIPSQQIWCGLLWQPRGYAVRQHEWPSWSWAGWTGPDDQMCEVFHPSEHEVQSNHSGDRWRAKTFYPAIYKFVYHEPSAGHEVVMASQVASADQSDRNLENCDSNCTHPCEKLSHLVPDKEFFSQEGYLRFRARVVSLRIEPYKPDTQSTLVLTSPSSGCPPLRRYKILRNDGCWIGTIFLSPVNMGHNIDGLHEYSYLPSTRDCKFVVMTNCRVFTRDLCPAFCGGPPERTKEQREELGDNDEAANTEAPRIFDDIFYEVARLRHERQWAQWMDRGQRVFGRRSDWEPDFQEHDPHRGMPFPEEVFLHHLMWIECSATAEKEEIGGIPVAYRRAIGVIAQDGITGEDQQEDICLG